MNRLLNAIILSAIVLFPGTSCSAQSAVTQIDDLERNIYGSVHTGVPLEQRIGNLEKSIWGQARNGGLQSRLLELNKLVAPASKPVLKSAGQIKTESQIAERLKSAEPESIFSTEPKLNSAKQLEGSPRSNEAPEAKLSASEFEDQEIAAINAEAENARISPPDQQALEQAQKRQERQALKRKATAASCTLAMRIGRRAAFSAIRGGKLWHW